MDTQQAGTVPASQPAGTANVPTAGQTPKKPSHRKKWLIIGGVIIGLMAVWQAMAMVLGGSGAKNNNSILYTALQNAAQRNIVLFAQERSNYDSEADLASSKPQSLTKSVSEFNVAEQLYSTVYVSFFSRGTADAGRCVEGNEYRPTTNRSPNTLQQAEDAVKGAATLYEYKAGQSDIYGPCQYARSGHPGKFSDGIVPVGLSADQAESWINYYKLRGPLTLKDEGVATVGAYTGHKISFQIGEQATGKPYKTDAFFYAYRDGDTGKTFGLGIPEADITDHFERLLEGLVPSGAKGFYLIDDKKKLPIYSEIATDADGAAGFKPYTSKQSYRYPDTPTMNEKTQLEQL